MGLKAAWRKGVGGGAGAWDPLGPAVLEVTLYFFGHRVVSSRGPSLQDFTQSVHVGTK